MTILLGAINKATNAYVYPKAASKKDKYKCPDCNKNLIFCKGAINTPHFRHHTDSVNPCYYYDTPNEAQIHKDAKMLLKKIIDDGVKLTFKRDCSECGCSKRFKIKETNEETKIKLEHSFKYNGRRSADVAYVEGKEIKYIFEICNTHSTHEDSRPDPWFEIDALSFIQKVNKRESWVKMRIPCKRMIDCDKCVSEKRMREEREEKRISDKMRAISGKSVRFESVLDAQWAGFFTKMNFRWQYRPFTINDYTPTFIILFDKFTLLVEVTQCAKFDELSKHAGKITASGWKSNYIIVGSKLFTGSGDAKVDEKEGLFTYIDRYQFVNSYIIMGHGYFNHQPNFKSYYDDTEEEEEDIMPPDDIRVDDGYIEDIPVCLMKNDIWLITQDIEWFMTQKCINNDALDFIYKPDGYHNIMGNTETYYKEIMKMWCDSKI